MVDSSGIPRAFDVGALSRELAALRRKVDLLESRRNYVSLDRIVEGGTIAAGVGEQLTETVQEKIVVNGDNLAVDALDGRVITGTTVQTDPEPEVGSKMTNGGVTVHGKAQVDTPSTGTQAETKMRAIMDSRRTKWSAGESDKWPGVWFESTPPPGSTPPQFPPGVTVGASSGLGLILQSANNGVFSPNAEVSVSPGVINLSASPVTGGKLMGFEAGLNLRSSGFGLGSRDENGITDASISNEQSDRKLRIYSSNGIDIEGDLTINGEPYAPGSGSGGGGPLEPDEDGVLRLTGTNGVNVSAGNGPLRLDGWYGVNINGPLTINGQPYTPGGTTPVDDSGWRSVTYQNGWMDYGNGFGGLQYRKLDGVLYIRGTIKGGVFYTNVTQLPEGFRPVVPEGTTAMEFPITVIANNGTSFTGGTMFAYSDGTLTYYSPPSSWVGPDRAIINSAFPL